MKETSSQVSTSGSPMDTITVQLADVFKHHHYTPGFCSVYQISIPIIEHHAHAHPNNTTTSPFSNTCC